uniref:Uncharacterized protein n=1 Tax=Vespula pensylvanica TaxID=30213 RepID=A0A834NQ59_VESPE|nr:hypothetical protein H0235_012024 [Vespula pensylvanica]
MDFNLEVSPRFTRLKAPPTFSNLAKKGRRKGGKVPDSGAMDTLQKEEEERKGTALSLKTTRYNRRKQQHMVTERLGREHYTDLNVSRALKEFYKSISCDDLILRPKIPLGYFSTLNAGVEEVVGEGSINSVVTTRP